MKTTILACETIRDEISYSVEKACVNYPTIWIESGLHDSPKLLNGRLQKELDTIKSNRVLVAFGYCGNAILGLKTGNYETVIPRVDDCISLLLGSNKQREEISAEYAAYFLTGGWLRGERNILAEYQHSQEKYGKELADMIMEKMYGHYRTLCLIDNGISRIEPLIKDTKAIAYTLNLEQKTIQASVCYIDQLITGPWHTDRFIIKPPYATVTDDDMHNR